MAQILNVRSTFSRASRDADKYLTDTPEQKKILEEDPVTYLRYRKNIESELNSRFRFILNGSAEQTTARAVSGSLMLEDGYLTKS